MKKQKYEIMLWRIEGKPDRWHVCQLDKLDIFTTYTPVSPKFNSRKEAQQFLTTLKRKQTTEAA